MAATTQTPFSVAGKTAIITGAGSGINLCFARLLLSQGCNVVIGDVALRPEAEQLVHDHAGEHENKPKAIFVKTDVTLWDDLSNLFAVAEKTFGGADIVCPGAGIFEPHSSNFWLPPGHAKSQDPVHGSDGVGHYQTLDINITHPIRVSQLAISHWLNSERTTGKASLDQPKRLVHISSIAAQIPGFSIPLYTASKHAISGFVRSLAELDKIGIRVNAVAPAIVKTPIWTDHPEKLLMIGETDGWIEPEEVAEALLKCCEDPGIVGGTILEVTAGETRSVSWHMDPGPTGLENMVTQRVKTVTEAFNWLKDPGWGVTK